MMNSSRPTHAKLSPSSEYALILGAGASAAVSLATQQVAAASVPVTALVAIGLMNRRRLDRQLKESEPIGHRLEAASHRQAESGPETVTTQPMPEVMATPSPDGRQSSSSAMPFGFARRRSQPQPNLHTRQQLILQKIGAQLQVARQEKSLSLRDIHERTFIQMYMLRAIELGDLSSLPEGFYVRAFIRKYALVLGLPGTDLADTFPVG